MSIPVKIVGLVLVLAGIGGIYYVTSYRPKQDLLEHEKHMAKDWGERKTGVPWKKLPSFSDAEK